MRQIINDSLVPVSTSEMMVSTSCDNSNGSLFDLDHRNIECASTKVINKHNLVVLILHAIHNSGRCRFVNNFSDFEPSNFASAGGRLSLCDAKIGGTGDHDFFYRTTKLLFSIISGVAQNI